MAPPAKPSGNGTPSRGDAAAAPGTRWELTVDGVPHAIEVGDAGVTVGDEGVAAKVVSRSEREVVVEALGHTFRVALGEPVAVDGVPVDLALRRLAPRLGRKGGDAAARAVPVKPPMPGRIVSVAVQDGDAVEKGAVLMVLEAMKMQNEIQAPTGGVVRSLAAKPGDTVEASRTLLVLEPPPDAPP